MYPFWLFIGLLIIAALFVRVVIVRRRPVRLLRDLAAARRLSLSAEDLIGIQERYHNLDMIRRGHSRHACNLLYGSTGTGLVTIFYYSYDLGFGVNRTNRQWWFAVVETACLHDHWRAMPAASFNGGRELALVDRFRVRTEHHHTLGRLIDAGIEELFRTAPPEYYWEARGPLVAVATPFDSDPQTPRGLLDITCDLARRLQVSGQSPYSG